MPALDLLEDTPTTPQGWPTGCIVDLTEADQQQAIIQANPETGPAEFVVAGAAVAGAGEGQTVMLCYGVRKVAGIYIVLFQKIGDCVDHMGVCVVNHLLATAILAGEPYEWRGETARGPGYAGSRVEVGGGQLRGDGSQGSWMARWLTEWGAVPVGVYDGIDLREYDPARSRAWGAPGRGVPDALELTLKQYPIRTAARVRSWEQARDAVAGAKSPVGLCSMQGFTRTRDAQGFCRPSGQWAHAMTLIGVRADRPGGLIQNSWGANGATGPKAYDQPDGSFWADAAVIDKMCRTGDCWTYSGAIGFPKRDLPLDILGG